MHEKKSEVNFEFSDNAAFDPKLLKSNKKLIPSTTACADKEAF